MKRLGLLITGSLVLWAVLLCPAWLLWQERALLHSAVALGLCLIPALGTMAWVVAAKQRSAEAQLLAVLGGTGVRLALVAGVGVSLYKLQGEYFTEVFLAWLLIFYLAILALEVILVVKDSASKERDWAPE